MGTFMFVIFFILGTVLDEVFEFHKLCILALLCNVELGISSLCQPVKGKHFKSKCCMISCTTSQNSSVLLRIV